MRLIMLVGGLSLSLSAFAESPVDPLVAGPGTFEAAAQVSAASGEKPLTLKHYGQPSGVLLMLEQLHSGENGHSHPAAGASSFSQAQIHEAMKWHVHQQQLRHFKAGEVVLASSLLETPVRIRRSQGPGRAEWTVEMGGDRRWIKEWGLPVRGWGGLEALSEHQLVAQIFGVTGSLEEAWDWLMVRSETTPQRGITHLPAEMWHGRAHAQYGGWKALQVHDEMVALPTELTLKERAGREPVAHLQILDAQLANSSIVGTTWPRR